MEKGKREMDTTRIVIVSSLKGRLGLDRGLGGKPLDLEGHRRRWMNQEGMRSRVEPCWKAKKGRA